MRWVGDLVVAFEVRITPRKIFDFENCYHSECIEAAGVLWMVFWLLVAGRGLDFDVAVM